MKKNTNFKISRETQQMIYEAAKGLPAVVKSHPNGEPIFKKVTVPGTQVTKKDLKPGVPLDPRAMYTLNRYVYEDHSANMIEMVKEFGPDAIQVYVNRVNDHQRQAIAQMKYEQSSIFKLKTFFKKLWSK